jgi:alanyl aminopeptidase
MLQDALPAARPIRSLARTPLEITDYNPLMFSKGCPVIGMIEAWLGPDAFRDGMRRYMKKHRGGNVTSADFYAALSDSSGGRDVGKVVESFVGQSGVPVVSAELECPPATGAAKGGPAVPFLRLRQEEYRNLDRKEASKKEWLIPVCVRYDAGSELATQCALLEGAEGRIELGPAKDRAPSCPSFFYPNANEVGYYRFRLTAGDLDKLATRGLGRLAESERLGLMANAWAAVWSGQLPASRYFELLRSYKNESSGVVLGEIFISLKDAENAVIADASRPAFARLVREIVGPAARRLGWKAKKGEPQEAKVTRGDMLFALGTLGQDPAVLAEATRLAGLWLADPAKADPETANLALVLAAKRGDVAMFDRLLALLKTPATPEVRRLARTALLAFDAAPLVQRVLNLTLDGTLKGQEMRDVVFALFRRKQSVEAAHAWVEKHFDEIVKASPNVPYALAMTPMNICHADRVHAVEAFLRPRLDKLGRGADLQKWVESGLRCAALAEKETAPTSAWLAGRVGGR